MKHRAVPLKKETLEYLILFLLGDQATEAHVAMVGYTNDPKEFDKYKVVIRPSGFFDEGDILEPHIKLDEIEGVPLLFGFPKVEIIGDTLVTSADFIAGAYYNLSRYDELIIHPEVRDQHGRFPGKESYLNKNGLLTRPIVDEYGAVLRNWLIERGVTDLQSTKSNKSTIKKVYLTHDVDEPVRFHSFKGFIHSILEGNSVKMALKDWRGTIQENSYFTFPWMIEQDRRLRFGLGEKVVDILFFLKAGGEAKQDKPFYQLRGDEINSVISCYNIDEARLGLHTSYSSVDDLRRISKEKGAMEFSLKQVIRDNRFHFLRGGDPQLFVQLERSEITDDYTLGYFDYSGFRLGTCRPVRCINPFTGDVGSLILHPLTAMDCTLDRKENMDLSIEGALNHLQRLAEQVKKHHGELVLLWHNSVFTNDSAGTYHRTVYQQFINTLLL